MVDFCDFLGARKTILGTYIRLNQIGFCMCVKQVHCNSKQVQQIVSLTFIFPERIDAIASCVSVTFRMTLSWSLVGARMSKLHQLKQIRVMVQMGHIGMLA